MGCGREWGGRASHTVVPWTWEPGGKGNCSFFEKVGTAGPWTSGGTETKRNRRFPSWPSTGGRSGAVLAVSWERANSNISGLPASGPLRQLPGRLGAWLGRRGALLSCKRLDAPAYVSIRPGAEQLWRAAHGDGDWGLAPGAAVDGVSRRGRMCWIASVCCCTAENCWAKPSTVSPTALPGRWGRRESVPCRLTSYLQMAHRMKCWAPRGTDQRNHPGTGRDVRCVRIMRSVGACPAEALTVTLRSPRASAGDPLLEPERSARVAAEGANPFIKERRDRSEIMLIRPQQTHESSTNAASACWGPRYWRQRSCPSSADRKRPQPEGHGRNGILKKTRLSVICSFRICSLGWSAQGNRWLRGTPLIAPLRQPGTKQRWTALWRSALFSST